MRETYTTVGLVQFGKPPNWEMLASTKGIRIHQVECLHLYAFEYDELVDLPSIQENFEVANVNDDDVVTLTDPRSVIPSQSDEIYTVCLLAQQ